ncbi:TIR domain-containing protein [Novipirellula rosea]|uniref:Thoeris protein ThsB TIR-like domain-containing protein n=1 Tax=Novipirellula rosea TaxID=1031540 RepID=A0ABP8NEW7_9BACT
MKRKCFYSFHYVPDCHRVAQIRNIGTIEGNRPASDNNWESVKNGGDAAIKKWIDDQMSGKSCVIVLIGAKTAGRKWINHEIVKAWDARKGIVGIYIHGIKNISGETTTKGDNPFDNIKFGNTDKKLSSVVKCYNPPGATSKEKYAWISEHLANAVEEAINIRAAN